MTTLNVPRNWNTSGPWPLFALARRCLLLAPVLLFVACGGSEDSHDHDADEATRGRLVAASATLAEVYVVDLDTHAVSTIPVAVENAIIQGTGGMSPFVWMVHYYDDMVEVVDLGTTFEREGTHHHANKTDPKLHSFSMTGGSPSHLVTKKGLTASWFDGTGEVRLIEEAQLAAGGQVDVKTVSANIPHHGVAFVHNSHLVLTKAELVDETPNVNGAVVYCLEECLEDTSELPMPLHDTTDTSTCTALHGEASYGKHMGFGCNEGILHVHYDTSGYYSEIVPYPDGAIRPFFLKSHPESPVLVGASGPGFVAFDTTTAVVTSHSLPASQMTFAFEDSEHLLVLAVDGNLYRVSLDDFSVEGEPLPLVPAFTTDDSANVFVAANRLYTLDSRDASVVAVDLEAWDVLDAGIVLPSAPNTFSFRAIGAVSPGW